MAQRARPSALCLRQIIHSQWAGRVPISPLLVTIAVPGLGPGVRLHTLDLDREIQRLSSFRDVFDGQPLGRFTRIVK
jgi:hypothetical protein